MVGALIAFFGFRNDCQTVLASSQLELLAWAFKGKEGKRRWLRRLARCGSYSSVVSILFSQLMLSVRDISIDFSCVSHVARDNRLE